MNQLVVRLDGAVPNNDDLDGIITTLNNDAGQAGVGLSSLAVTQPGTTTHGSANAIPLQISVGGGYFAVHRFLDEMRDGSRLIVVDTVSLSSGSSASAGNGTSLTATITARAFITTGTAVAPVATPAVLPKASSAAGTGVLESPIDKARATAAAASAAAANEAKAGTTGGTP